VKIKKKNYLIALLIKKSKAMVFLTAQTAMVLTAPVISTITNSGTVTLPTATDTLIGRTTTDSLTNKAIDLSTNTVSGTVADFNTALTDDSFCTLTNTVTLTNKTINGATIGGVTVIQSGATITTPTILTPIYSWLQQVRVATTTSGTLASSFENGEVVDGITLVSNDRILIKDQALATENGIYIVEISGPPTRADDLLMEGTLPFGVSVSVLSGNTNAGTIWSTAEPPAIGQAMNWSEVGGLTATETVTLTNKTIDVADNTLINTWLQRVRVGPADNVDISSELIDAALLDGVTLATGDRVLLSAQTDPVENGIYVVVASGAASRSADMAEGAVLNNGAIVAVAEGDSGAGLLATLTNTGTVTIGTTAATWGIVRNHPAPANIALISPKIFDGAEEYQYVFAVANLTDDRTITLPLLTGDDTFVFEAHTQTLTNKTINDDSNLITHYRIEATVDTGVTHVIADGITDEDSGWHMYPCDTAAAAAPMSITLPPISSCAGLYTIYDSTGSAATYSITVGVDGGSSELINGAETYVITGNYNSITLFSSGAHWFLI
jgi:hypothetical protein